MKKFNIGTSDFPTFINKGYAYVDKTEIIYNLINDTMGAQFFLSRPRRFGKSLLLSTIKCIFEGKKELFRGLKIENLWQDWDETFPVLHLSMNECTGSIDRVKHLVKNQLVELAKYHNVELTIDNDAAIMFRRLINLLVEKSNNGQIVLLLDEYDKPMLDHIGSKDVIPYQTFLNEFYTVIKDTDKYQRFTLITGVSKFSYVSIFSGLNNLKDLTMNRKTSSLLGYTHEEMHENFKENIQAFAEKNNLSYEQMFDNLVYHYDGYCFSTKLEKVFNPVSVANVLTDFEFKNYWFSTGTPGWLVSYLKSKPCFLDDKIQVSEIKLNTFDPVNPDVHTLLIQTGYLTIKDMTNAFGIYRYTLDFPNNEVKEGFSKWLMLAYVSDNSNLNTTYQYKLLDATNMGKPEDLINTLHQFFTNIPYNLQDKLKIEQAYQIILHTVCVYLGINVESEFTTNNGRMDILIKTPNFVYVIELKLDKPAQSAIDQIHEKAYYEQFKGQNKKIYLLGISFSSEEKNISDYIIEKVN